MQTKLLNKNNPKSLWYLRWQLFYTNRLARFSLFCFIGIFIVSLFAPFLANDKPLLIYKNNKFYFPIFIDYSEIEFGGDFYTTPDYKDSFVKNLFANDFIIYPLIEYSADSIDWTLKGIPPTPPSKTHLLGTDDQGRDVCSRLLYGLRTSLLFGIILSICSVCIGIIVGGIQGYYGGVVDLFGQRILEIWGGMPTLFIIIIVSSFILPTFWIILGIVLLFSWTSIVSVVRAEFLRARTQDYIKASKVLGFSDIYIMFVHILPNALIATITYIPFITIGSITTLATLDFLGFGMPIGSASLGELLNQGKNNIQSPHLGIIGFIVMSFILSILVFIGDGVRTAFSFKKK